MANGRTFGRVGVAIALATLLTGSVTAGQFSSQPFDVARRVPSLIARFVRWSRSTTMRLLVLAVPRVAVADAQAIDEHLLPCMHPRRRPDADG